MGKLQTFGMWKNCVDIESLDAVISDWYEWYGLQEELEKEKDLKQTGFLYCYYEHCLPYGGGKEAFFYGFFDWRYLKEGIEITDSGKVYARCEEKGNLLFEREGEKIVFCGEKENGVKNGFGVEITYGEDGKAKHKLCYYQNGVKTHERVGESMKEIED